MKFIQIATAHVEEGNIALYALGEDGCIYAHSRAVQTAIYARDEHGNMKHDEFGDLEVTRPRIEAYYWQKIELPFGNPFGGAQ